MGNLFYLFVEGPDDYKFIKRIFKRYFETDYVKAIPIEYAQDSSEDLEKFLTIINNSDNDDYLIFGDYDEEEGITNTKNTINNNKFNDVADITKILIVIKEIEGWYLAGLSDEDITEIGIDIDISTTNHITKEMFNNNIPRKDLKYKSVYMSILLEKFKIVYGKQRNNSFRYCCNKIGM